MRKKLCYAMPRVPLLKHRQRNAEDNDGPENDNDVVPIVLEPFKSHVGQMAKKNSTGTRKEKKGV